MHRLVHASLAAIDRCVRRFRGDASGQIAIIFVFSSLAILVGVGGGIDLARAYAARQRLSEVAVMTCQYATRPSIAQTAASNYSGTNGFGTYVTAVNAFANAALASQHWTGSQPTDASNVGTNYFSATPAVAGATAGGTTGPTSQTVELKANVTTSFMQLIRVSQIPVHAKINCLTSAAAPQLVASPGASPPSILQEGFETPCSSYCFTLPNGGSGTSSTPTSTFPASSSYTGSGGRQWYIVGYCLEADIVGIINGTTPEGTHSAELDCDNGSGSTGNSSISTKVYLAAGHYELRYNYRSRVDYPSYDPAYICGTTAGDVAWANDSAFSGAIRTNQINVYLDMAATSAAPLHTTIDGTQQLAGTNLIDVCVYSPTWVERSVKITVTTPAYYWLSFAADGGNDSYGGQLDNIRVCQETCAGSLQDNFPTSWVAANNNGVNKVLYEDTFENPTYAQDPYTSSKHSKGGNLANSLGVTIASGCSYAGVSPLGYPCQSPTGWAVAPYNEVVYWEQGATQGSQYISLQGWNGFSNTSDPLYRSISKSFLLDPGYYNISYIYTSLTDFSYDFVYSNGYYPVCTAVPTSADNLTLWGKKNGLDYASGTLYQQYISTDFLNVYVANGQLVSTPVLNSTLGGVATYNNPNGTTSTSPSVPLDNGTNFAAYNALAVNPVIDTCYYSSGHAWVNRSVNIKITKPGLYWLAFSTLGDPLTGLGAGPGIDDVKLTALGSYTMGTTGNPQIPTATSPIAAANATPQTIPVPAPQPDTIYSNNGAFNGFYIVADPFIPPGADQ